jgi:hypothetical protein
MENGRGRRGAAVAREGLTGVAVAAFAIACCGTAPLAVAALGGLAVGAWLGIGAVIALAAVALLLTSARRRPRGVEERER